MKGALDVYAMSNPAICAVVITAFVRGHSRPHERRPDLTLAFLPVAITLSQDVLRTFDGTGYATGLIGWLNRAPQTTLGLASRIEATRDFSRAGLLFASSSSLIEVDVMGRLVLRSEGRRLVERAQREEVLAPVLASAGKLGRWVSEIASTETVLHCFGVSL